MGVQFRTVEFWYGVAFGLFIASAGAVMILAAFSLSTPEYWGAVATISAIPVSVLAALVALLVARYQMEQARQQDLAAARAVLPLALTQIHDVIGDGLRLCASSTPDPEDVLPRLTLSDTVTEVLRDCIRASTGRERDWLVLLISRFQITRSRTEGHFRPARGSFSTTPKDHTRAGLAFEWAVLHGVLGQLFDFSRHDSVAAALDPQDVANAPYSLDLHFELLSLPFRERFADHLHWLAEAPATPERLAQL